MDGRLRHPSTHTLSFIGTLPDHSGEVLELADRHDLGSCAARRTGSSPVFPIKINGKSITGFIKALIRITKRTQH